MALPFSEGDPLAAGPSLPFLDPLGRDVAVENVVFDNDLNVYDRTQIQFSPEGAISYRGKFHSPKENLKNLSPQFQAIYYKSYPPKKQGDYTTYRSRDQPASSSSKSSDNSPRMSHQKHGDGAMSPVVADGTDAAGLLNLPINIDGAVPLSHAYQQFEPRGYKLIADWQGTDGVFEQIGRLAPLIGTLIRKRKHFGLSSEEVVMYGGLSCTPCRPSNLSDSLKTTLFRQDNFYNCPQDVYTVLTPALKLAEMFITDPTQITYWSTLAFGKRVIDLELTAKTRICHERLVEGVNMTDTIYDQTMLLLNRMGKIVEYRFPLDEEFTSQSCYGYTKKADRRWNLAPEHHETLTRGHLWPRDRPFPMARSYPKDPWDDGQVINLHPDFFTAAKKFSKTQNQDIAGRLRFNFWFATNICHELAHVFELRSSQSNFERSVSSCRSLEDFKVLVDPRFAAGTIEAFWSNSTWAEAGSRWEWQTFGGRVQPISNKTDASLGMIIFNADGSAKTATPLFADLPVGTCIQMGFMEEVQQQSFWSRPQRSLKFPISAGARAYLAPTMQRMTFQDHLKARDETLAVTEHVPAADLLTDPEDIALYGLLTDVLNKDRTSPTEEPSAKRRKLNDAASATRETKTRTTKELPQRGRLGQRLGQPLIRRYINKADTDTKVMREETLARAAEEETQRAEEAAKERAAAEEARRYRAPSPGQKDLHEFFRFPHESPDNDIDTGTYLEEVYVDPACKQPEGLTLADKWTIAEEFNCLEMDWEPVEFHAQRRNHPSWRPAHPFNPDDPYDFQQESLDALLSLRQRHPGQSWPERRAREKKLYEQKKSMARTLGLMDELITCLGYSRIECHQMFSETGRMPMGMTLANFGAYQPLLDAFRLTQQIQSSADYRSAVGRGDVAAGATGIGLIAEDSKSTTPLPESNNDRTAKITEYFPTMKKTPTDARAPDPAAAAFPRPTKVPTPDETRRKYDEWVAAGADLRNMRIGLHPAQVLSATLGGSLQTVRPSELQRVVEEATRRLEAARAEKRRREAKARADAAEERERRERRMVGSGSGSGSGSGGVEQARSGV